MHLEVGISRARLVACFLAAAASISQAAFAREVEGIKLDNSINLANQELTLSGAGVRTRENAKVLVVGLYLDRKYNSTQEVLAARGAKRTKIVMLRDLDVEKFATSFIAGMQANADKEEKSKIVYQLVKFGEICASVGMLGKGDVITFDFIPGSGTHVSINGRERGEPLSGDGFYQLLLKFFLGDKPTDPQLKRQLLG